MKKILFSLTLAILGILCLVAQNKLSSPSLNFLQSYELTTPTQRTHLKSVYALQENERGAWVSAFLHLENENEQTGLEENGVRINAQYGTILSTLIPVENLRAISQLPSVKYIEVGQRVRPLMSRVRTEEFSNIDNGLNGVGLNQAYTGKDVVVGIIDCGFQYNHINFYDTTGETLRVKRVWNQNKDSSDAPEGYTYGTEYDTTEEIIAAKSDNASESHATHVTGIAAGAYKAVDFHGAAPDADLVFVSYNIYDNSGSNASISDGVKYIYDYAESVGKPCVINMSLGMHTGPHDGNSTFDRICDQLQGEGKLLVGAAGNEGDFDLHVTKTLTNTDKTMKALLTFDAHSSAAKATTVDIWGDANKPISMRIFVYDKNTNTEFSTSPFYATEIPGSYTLTSLSGATGAIIISTNTDPFSQKGNINILINNLYTKKSNYEIGIEVKNESDEESTVHAWVDDYYSGFSTSSIDGFTQGSSSSSVGEIGGTGKRIISVGAYVSCNNMKHKYSSTYNKTYETINDLASFSSIGPTADNRMKPDIAAPGTKIASSYNATSCNNSRYTYYQTVTNVETVNGTKYYFGSMDGTSMASPVVTGILASWLQANPKLTPEQVRKILKETAVADSYTGEIAGTGNNKWGYGKINAHAGLLKSLELANIENVTGAPTRPMVYPNPATDRCHVILPTDDSQVSLSIVTPNGAVVYAQTLDAVHAGTPIQVELQGILPGLYLIQVMGENTQYATKLIIQ